MIAHMIEILLGLQYDTLRDVGVSFYFAPIWPWQHTISATIWNIALVVVIVWVALRMYRRAAISPRIRISLMLLRCCTLGLLLLLLNRPGLTLHQDSHKSSVVAVLLDSSASMSVPDAAPHMDEAETPPMTTRLAAAVEALGDLSHGLLAALARQHRVQVYQFSEDAQFLGNYGDEVHDASANDQTLHAVQQLSPAGTSSWIVRSIHSVAQDLSGQNLAGIILLTDGRQVPRQASDAMIDSLKADGIKIFPIVVGSQRPVKNVAIASVKALDSVFQGDDVLVHVQVRSEGLQENQPVEVALIDEATGHVLDGPDGKPAVKSVSLNDGLTDVEMQFKPIAAGMLNLTVKVAPQSGELAHEDNQRTVQIDVLDAKITVLYVDGYPRWDYRYIKNTLIRDKTIQVSCLLTSAEPGFVQEGDLPIRRFPETMQELTAYDVILFGDVDPQQFSSSQLELLKEYVSQQGGGFGMVAGLRWSPQAYAHTAVATILPVELKDAQVSSPAPLTQVLRPTITPIGMDSSIFRFFTDPQVNQQYLHTRWPGIYWYYSGIAAKPGVGQVLAVDSSHTGAGGHDAPILVTGRYGAGRTMFLATDDSWRWRYYQGEHVFDTFWVQQLRTLSRGRKAGQRRAILRSDRPSYELGERITANLDILDARLLSSLPAELPVKITSADGQLLAEHILRRQTDESTSLSGRYTASWTADRIGSQTLTVAALSDEDKDIQLPVDVQAPRLELIDPSIDPAFLQHLAQQTGGAVVPLAVAADRLDALIPEAHQVVSADAAVLLWSAPLVLALFGILLAGEWILRKRLGMI